MEKLTPARRKTPDHYPGYPSEHLVYPLTPEQPLQNIDIPDGPWAYNIEPLPSPEQTRQFNIRGLATDSLGRPLHPWANQLLSDEYGGITTGKGAYWNWGPNPTADPIVITTEDRPRVLLIERSDTGVLALPGGFVDTNEETHHAALREAQEETGIHITTPGKLIYHGPVADLRTTLHAWAETSAYLFTVDTPVEVTGGDDALNAGWYYLDELPGTLFGSHAQLVALALK